VRCPNPRLPDAYGAMNVPGSVPGGQSQGSGSQSPGSQSPGSQNPGSQSPGSQGSGSIAGQSGGNGNVVSEGQNGGAPQSNGPGSQGPGSQGPGSQSQGGTTTPKAFANVDSSMPPVPPATQQYIQQNYDQVKTTAYGEDNVVNPVIEKFDPKADDIVIPKTIASDAPPNAPDTPDKKKAKDRCKAIIATFDSSLVNKDDYLGDCVADLMNGGDEIGVIHTLQKSIGTITHTKAVTLKMDPAVVVTTVVQEDEKLTKCKDSTSPSAPVCNGRGKCRKWGCLCDYAYEGKFCQTQSVYYRNGQKVVVVANKKAEGN